MLLIILPIRNESPTIEDTAKNIYKWCRENIKDFQIVFIDDNSTDDTAKKIKSLNMQVIQNQFDQGKGSALKAGYIISNLTYKIKQNDLIAFMDGDGQIDPKEIKTFLNRMELDQADAVIGNKRHTYSISSYKFKRMVISKMYNFLIRLLFSMDYQDTQCGLKILRKYALDSVITKLTIKKFAFDLELIVALRGMKMRVADAPVMVKDQLNAGSVNLPNIIQTLLDTLSVWNKYKKGFYCR